MFSEVREFQEFTAVLLNGVGNVIITKGNEHKVEINSNQDVVSKIKTEVINKELVISMVDTLPVWLISFPKLDIKVTLSDVKSLRVTGVGKLRCEETLETDSIVVFNSGVGGIHLKLSANDVKTYLAGVGEIELSGTTSIHQVEISGTGKINAYSLKAEDVTIKATGIGECVIYATNNLEVNAGGISRVKYRGHPKVKSSRSGLGNVEAIP